MISIVFKLHPTNDDSYFASSCLDKESLGQLNHWLSPVKDVNFEVMSIPVLVEFVQRLVKNLGLLKLCYLPMLCLPSVGEQVKIISAAKLFLTLLERGKAKGSKCFLFPSLKSSDQRSNFSYTYFL